MGLAVVVGVIGLQIVDDSAPQSPSVASPAVTTTPGTGPVATTTTGRNATTTTGRNAATTTGRSATTTTATVRRKSQVKVKVYNASGISGSAAAMTDRLRGLGYDMGTPATLASTVTGYLVECKPGFEREAAVLATTDVQRGAVVQPWPATKNLPPGLGDADCIVILGKTQ